MTLFKELAVVYFPESSERQVRCAADTYVIRYDKVEETN